MQYFQKVYLLDAGLEPTINTLHGTPYIQDVIFPNTAEHKN